MEAKCPEPEDEASVPKESPESGEGAGRLPQSIRELCGDLSIRRNRWDTLLKKDNNNNNSKRFNLYLLISLIHSVADSF